MKEKRPTLDKKCYSSVVAYRRLNRPDDDMQVYDPMPIMPPPHKQYRGHKFVMDYHREIAWSIDYRGDNDDIPTLLFVGAGYTLVKKVFRMMFGKSSPMFSGFRLYRDSYIYQRQGKAWVRIAVELRNFSDVLMSLRDLGENIANRMKDECLCKIQYMKLDKFLNV